MIIAAAWVRIAMDDCEGMGSAGQLPMTASDEVRHENCG